MSDDVEDLFVTDYTEWATDTDRQRAMLTRMDREKLLDSSEMGSSSKHRVRKRINGAVRDFAFLIETGNEEIIFDAIDVPEAAKYGSAKAFISVAVQYALGSLSVEELVEDDFLETIIADALSHEIARRDDLIESMIDPSDALEDVPAEWVEDVSVEDIKEAIDVTVEIGAEGDS